MAGLPLDRVADLACVCVRAEQKAISPEILDGIDVSGRAVLFATGWDQHWRTERYGDPDHPFLTSATAEVLMTRGARLVGIDSVNVDDTTGGIRPVHTALLEAGIPIIEHLTGLDRLVGLSSRFFAAPESDG